jgi:hypothetical protein
MRRVINDPSRRGGAPTFDCHRRNSRNISHTNSPGKPQATARANDAPSSDCKRSAWASEGQ